MTEPLRIVMECDGIDSMALWDVAAARAVQEFAMDLDDVIDTIGPREDPQVEACVYMVFDGLLRASGASATVAITTPAAAPTAPAPRRPLPAPALVNVGTAVAPLCAPRAPRAA